MSGMSGAISIRVDAARRSSTGGGYPPAVDSPQSDMQARRPAPRARRCPRAGRAALTCPMGRSCRAAAAMPVLSQRLCVLGMWRTALPGAIDERFSSYH